MENKKKNSWNNKKIHQKRNKIGERWSIDLFTMNNMEGIWERGGNEVKRIYKKIKIEELG